MVRPQSWEELTAENTESTEECWTGLTGLRGLPARSRYPVRVLASPLRVSALLLLNRQPSMGDFRVPKRPPRWRFQAAKRNRQREGEGIASSSLRTSLVVRLLRSASGFSTLNRDRIGAGCFPLAFRPREARLLPGLLRRCPAPAPWKTASGELRRCPGERTLSRGHQCDRSESP